MKDAKPAQKAKPPAPKAPADDAGSATPKGELDKAAERQVF